jgi:DNA-directed RNA polymerase beta subunit
MNFDLNQEDLFLVGNAELEEKGLVHHHLTSANELYEIGIPQIITQVFKLDMRIDKFKVTSKEEENIDYINVKVNFDNVNISKPTFINHNSGKEEVIFPNSVRIKEKTYKSILRVDIKIIVNVHMKNGSIRKLENEIKNFKICKMPIMVGSKWCNTYGLSNESLNKLNEDPSDPGGYFIIKGIEWAVDCVENILYNKVRIFKNEGYKKEQSRAEFISKPGDFYLNSDQFIVKWLLDGQITIELVRDKLKNINIPFYLIFRILGWNTDKKIYDNILFNYNNSISKELANFITKAFNVKYDILEEGRTIYSQNEALEYLSRKLELESFQYLKQDPKITEKDRIKKISNFILDNIDIHFLQHIGSDMTSRDKKARFLCIILRKMFLVKLKNMEPTDRDSYNSKRIAAAGVNCAKTFKTHFNATIIQQIKRKFYKDLANLSVFSLDLVSIIKSSVYGYEFEKALIQAITAGNKSEISVKKKIRINRLTSQLLNRKNQLNTYATLRQVTATSSDSSKQSERANEMRRVHMSFIGYICVIHSPEGEKVGINKQLALFSFITKASFSEVIKNILLEDEEVYCIDDITYKDIADKNLSNIYVNGDWIGCCKNAIGITKKYRQKRRNLEISPEITIVWNNTQDEVEFWADVGRVIRPLLIVYNNQRDPEMIKKLKLSSLLKNSKGFIQGLAITQDHIDKLYSKKITTQDLLKDGVIEYISAEEQENMFLCSNYDKLVENKNNELYEYTHCDIPQAMLGITALTSPFANHNQAQRIVYQTSQSKQTCGIPTKNWTYRTDKDTFVQYNNEMPIVKTISNKYLHPNGSNCIVALMCNTGFNQEDSIIINKAAIDRGLFNGSKFTFYKTELEQKEEFANPDSNNTMDIKVASHEKLVNGIIKKGSIINKNDAIIGKIFKITKKDLNSKYQYVDKSIIYKDSEPAIVHNVIIDRNEDDKIFCKVILRKVRPVQIGDKFSARSGQKAVCGLLLDEADMPKTKSGVSPTILVNPHSLPSRMTIGQLIESVVGNLCAEKCAQIDATIFKKVDIEDIGNQLESMGLDRSGYHRLYNGITGEYIDTEIFMGPTFFQRLQKFTIDTQYAVSNGSTDCITYQPLEGGKSSGGGLRIGEMERDVIVSHSAMKFMTEKFNAHSDGYKNYVCRCGKMAIVNIKEGIYKCNYCKDNADIVAYDTSWSSKLFIQEMESMNVGIKQKPQPFTFNTNNDDINKMLLKYSK